MPDPALVGALVLACGLGSATTPDALQQPGTQPREQRLDPSRNCRACHADYEPASEPWSTWQGSMMANATRDPVFWAAFAVAEQDFVPNATAWLNLMPATTPDTGGAGALCLRCHTPSAFLDGRSTPTDGSALQTNDYEGVGCDLCHRVLDPVSGEGQGAVSAGFEPWWTNPSTLAQESFHGSGQYVIERFNNKRGPYDNPATAHGFVADPFQREGALCGTCHDVSNPVTGTLAANSGRLDTTTLGPRAAFDHPPYAYGVVERTFSEWRSSRWPSTPTSAFASLPFDLRRIGGAPEWASRLSPYVSSSDPAFNPPRSYSCQTCHLPPAAGRGSNGVSPLRADQPVHDLTGGNTWVPEAMIWLSAQGKLRGGALTPEHEDALRAGVLRARATLRRAAWVEARPSSDRLTFDIRTVNLTGHKLPSGYPEGRRVWLEIRFYDGSGNLIREHGHYDAATATLTRDTRIFEAHLAITRDWAEALLGLGWDAALPLSYRLDGSVEWTLGDLVAGAPGSALETFHFVLNNSLIEDRRIPPWGMDPALATERNAAPVPSDAYPTLPDGTLRFWDSYSVPLPAGTARAEVALRYQTASREYINFLRHANTTNTDGEDLYQAWLATGMSAPEEMARTTWIDVGCTAAPAPLGPLSGVRTSAAEFSWPAAADATGYRLYRHTTPARSDPPAWLDGNATTVSEAVLGDGRSWYYDLRPFNDCGEAQRPSRQRAPAGKR